MGPAPTTHAHLSRTALRQQFREARRALSAAESRCHSLRIARHFLCSPLAWRGRRIAAYIAIDGEPVLDPLLRRLVRMGKVLALPAIRRDGRMDFRAHRFAAPMRVNQYGIQEPAADSPVLPSISLGVVLTPLVAFDQDGNRLGMGGGFYDRHFGALPKNLRPPLVGVAHEAQRASRLPSALWDVPLDAVLTEAGLRAIGKPPPCRTRQRHLGDPPVLPEV